MQILSHQRVDWKILVFTLVIACLLTGCATYKQEYENPELGIKLIKPNSWDVRYHERSGSIMLEARNRIGSLDSARVEIQGNACFPIPAWFNGASEVIESDIDRIRNLYSLDSVSIIQKPIKIEDRKSEVVRAIVAVPTISLPENDDRNQMGDRDPNLFQTIQIFLIRDKEYSIMAYIYEGNSEALNAEAEEIVASIQVITCSP